MALQELSTIWLLIFIFNIKKRAFQVDFFYILCAQLFNFFASSWQPSAESFLTEPTLCEAPSSLVQKTEGFTNIHLKMYI